MKVRTKSEKIEFTGTWLLYNNATLRVIVHQKGILPISMEIRDLEVKIHGEWKDMLESWIQRDISFLGQIVSPPKMKCDVPPKGWKCSRMKGHEGPCAATPEGTTDD